MKKKNIKKIQEKLMDFYPDVKTALRHNKPFELLIATILSAQCTDKQVNQVTENLFAQLKLPEDFANTDLELIEKLIYSTGFYKNKAKNIQNCSKMLVEKYNGNIPDSLSELVKLPGVGRKTANVVLGSAFGIPGIVVDTHVLRISLRLGLSESRDPKKVEFDLMNIVPKNEWNDFSLRLVFFGREICFARKPACNLCPLSDICFFHLSEA